MQPENDAAEAACVHPAATGRVPTFMGTATAATIYNQV